jgi:endogenous inhibitor of DNA gyrase (YacG/DUF329 family)
MTPDLTVTRTCPICGCLFKNRANYWHVNKTCSKQCGYQLALLAERKDSRITKTCLQCKKSFSVYPSQSARKFCSYKCHIDNGGSLRAGEAAARAKVKYGAKKDFNHVAISKVLEELGAQVFDTSSVGCGFPDCVIGMAGFNHLIEIKNPNTRYGKKGLNPRQKKWTEQWIGSPVHIVRTSDDAVELIKELRLNPYYRGKG